MSKTLRITLIVTAIVVVLAALGFGLGFGLKQKNEMLTINVDGENVAELKLKHGENISKYLRNNVQEYTDYTTCGWYVDEDLTTLLSENMVADEELTLYTKTATLDKLKFTLNEDGETFEVSSINENIWGDVVIPRMYMDDETQTGGLVSAIGRFDAKYITSVFLPNGIKTINLNAFFRCSMIKTITIPKTVETIVRNSFSSVVEVYNYSPNFNIEYGSDDNGRLGKYAKIIYNAEDLTGDKPESRIKIIGDVKYYIYEDEFIAVGGSFNEKEPSNLLNVVLDERTTEIYRETFYYDKYIQSIIIPEGVKTIGEWALNNCSSLTSLTIPASITRVDNAAFNYLESLEEVVINSVYCYTASTGTYACGALLKTVPTVKVLASIVDDPENTNNWLNGSAWTKSEVAEEGYYTFTRV